MAVAVVSWGCVDVREEPTPPVALVINEVAAAGLPHDWFEVVNAGTVPIDLSELVFVDERGDLIRARSFSTITLAPGDRHVQEVIRTVHGFQLGDDEELSIYRHDDRTLVASVRWRVGASPPGGSYARHPDLVGAFSATWPASRGAVNPERR